MTQTRPVAVIHPRPGQIAPSPGVDVDVDAISAAAVVVIELMIRWAGVVQVEEGS
jgi:hypothetical protein